MMKRQIIRFFGVVIAGVCGIFARQGLVYGDTYKNANYTEERYPVILYHVSANEVPNMPGGYANSTGWGHKACLKNDLTVNASGDNLGVWGLYKNDFYIDDVGGTGWKPSFSGRPKACESALESQCSPNYYATGECLNSYYLCSNGKYFSCGTAQHSDGVGHSTQMTECWCDGSGIYMYDKKVLDWLGGCEYGMGSGSSCSFYYTAQLMTYASSNTLYTAGQYRFLGCTSGSYKTSNNLTTYAGSYTDFSGYCVNCPTAYPSGLVAGTQTVSAGTLITSCKVNGSFIGSGGTYTYVNDCTYNN